MSSYNIFFVTKLYVFYLLCYCLCENKHNWCQDLLHDRNLSLVGDRASAPRSQIQSRPSNICTTGAPFASGWVGNKIDSGVPKDHNPSTKQAKNLLAMHQPYSAFLNPVDSGSEVCGVIWATVISQRLSCESVAACGPPGIETPADKRLQYPRDDIAQKTNELMFRRRLFQIDMEGRRNGRRQAGGNRTLQKVTPLFFLLDWTDWCLRW